jgi:hypothetical protein
MSMVHTPWDFNVGTQQFVSPNQSQHLYYQTDKLSELGMGGPLRGPCFWVKPNGEEVLVHANCGGPPVWQQQGDYFAIPIWEFSFFHSWTARVGVVALSSRKLILFRKSFNVLQLEAFDESLIFGVDSPIFPKALKFYTSTAAIARIISL